MEGAPFATATAAAAENVDENLVGRNFAPALSPYLLPLALLFVVAEPRFRHFCTPRSDCWIEREHDGAARDAFKMTVFLARKPAAAATTNVISSFLS